MLTFDCISRLFDVLVRINYFYLLSSIRLPSTQQTLLRFFNATNVKMLFSVIRTSKSKRQRVLASWIFQCFYMFQLGQIGHMTSIFISQWGNTETISCNRNKMARTQAHTNFFSWDTLVIRRSLYVLLCMASTIWNRASQVDMQTFFFKINYGQTRPVSTVSEDVGFRGRKNILLLYFVPLSLIVQHFINSCTERGPASIWAQAQFVCL